MHSKNFEKIRDWYHLGMWNKSRVHSVVNRTNGITPEEYEEIVGEPFEA